MKLKRQKKLSINMEKFFSKVLDIFITKNVDSILS